jgi:predicted dinucleotide-binding enzyme
MTTVGLIGSGNIGITVAQLAIDAGHDVVLSNSRGPETLADTVAELGPRASAATSGEAAAIGDIVVVTVPVNAFPDLPAAPLAGKTAGGLPRGVPVQQRPAPDGPGSVV